MASSLIRRTHISDSCLGRRHSSSYALDTPVPSIPSRTNVCRSRVDLRIVDIAAFPRLRGVVPYVGELVPGDLLHFVRYTWHYFWASVSVSASTFLSTEITASRIWSLLCMHGTSHILGVGRQFVMNGCWDAHMRGAHTGCHPSVSCYGRCSLAAPRASYDFRERRLRRGLRSDRQ